MKIMNFDEKYLFPGRVFLQCNFVSLLENLPHLRNMDLVLFETSF